MCGRRSAARELSPRNGNQHVVQRALFHGARLESADASWAHQLRRGFSALLAASLPEPVPALVGEDLAAFRSIDAAWLARQTRGESESSLSEPVRPLADATGTLRWPTASLRPNPLNPRRPFDPTNIDQLAASIIAHADHGGILQPLLITPDGTVVAGHRRLAAARRVGLADVPVIVRALSPVEQLESQLTENLQRSELSAIEEARAYSHLLDAGATLASIAVRRRLTVVQVRQLVETALALPPMPAPATPLPSDDEPSGGGLSHTRLETIEALRAQAAR